MVVLVSREVITGGAIVGKTKPTSLLCRFPGVSWRLITRAPGLDAREAFSRSFDSWVKVAPSTKGLKPAVLSTSTSMRAAREAGTLESETTTNWKAAFLFELGKPSHSVESFAVTIDPPGEANRRTQTGEPNPEV